MERCCAAKGGCKRGRIGKGGATGKTTEQEWKYNVAFIILEDVLLLWLVRGRIYHFCLTFSARSIHRTIGGK